MTEENNKNEAPELAVFAKSLDSVKDEKGLAKFEADERKGKNRPGILQLIGARRMELSTGADPVLAQMQKTLADMAERLEGQEDKSKEQEEINKQLQQSNSKLMLDNTHLSNQLTEMNGGVVMTAEAILTRNLCSTASSWLPRDFKKGEKLFKYTGEDNRHSDGRSLVNMTDDESGKGEYFGVPKGALLWQD